MEPGHRASFATRFVASVLFPLHEFVKGHHSSSLLRELESSQWFEPDRLRQLQVSRLQTFLQQLGQTVPYYRRVFAQVGFEPLSVRSLDDLNRLPLLDKALITGNARALKADGATHLIRGNTGGSSGEPLIFYMGMSRVSHDVAAKWRATRWWGVDIGDPEIVLWGSPIEIGRHDRIKALRDACFRTHLFPAFQMSPAQMDHYLERLRRLRPKMLFGYASALALLAGHAVDRKCDMRSLGVKVAFATGETLYPEQRRIIEEVFAAPVANGYGSRDAGFIAHQCPAGSLHVSAEHILVELLDASAQSVPVGQPGEIVVTHTATAEFPFVRYRTGDVGVMQAERCSCGRGLPVLKEVQGRSTDFVRTKSGNTMHALALIYEVRDKPGVKAFKFIQQEDFSLDLLLVAGDGYSQSVEDTIKIAIARRMGDGSNLRLHRVDRIEAERSGKYRYVVSHAPRSGHERAGEPAQASP